MKKLIIFVFILVGIASCQKEVIKPNSGNSPLMEKKSTQGGNTTIDPNTGLPVTIGDDGNPIVVEDDITDPLRKRDKN
jgi:hypothetical protein